MSLRLFPHRLLPLIGLLGLATGSCVALGQTEPPPVPALSLEEAIRLALAKNYAIRVESFNPSVARANVTTAFGAFDPSLQLSYKYTESGDPQPSDPFSGEHPASSIATQDAYEVGVQGLTPWGLQYWVGMNTRNSRGTYNAFKHQYYSFGGISVEQPLLRNFGFGAGLITVRIAKADRAISQWEYRQQIMDTVTQVIYAYEDLYFAQANLRVALRSRDLAASLLAENERRFKVGNVSESDVTTARARVAFRETSVLSAMRAVDARSNALRLLISDEHTMKLLNGPLEVVAPPSPPETKVNAAADFAAALNARPDYQRSRLLVQKRRLNRSYQRNQFLPDVKFVGSYGYHGLGDTWPESRRNLEDRNTISYTAGAVVTVPLTFAQQRGRLRAANLQLRQSEAQVEQLEQQIVVDLGNAAAEIESSQKRLIAARNARELTKQSLDDEIKLHRAGKSTTLFVLQAQEYFSQAELMEYIALVDVYKAIAEYDRQLGRTLDKHGINLEEAAAPTVAPRS